MLWAQVDEIMKSGLTTSASTLLSLQGETSEVSTMVNAYLAEPLLSRHANVLATGVRRRHCGHFLAFLPGSI